VQEKSLVETELKQVLAAEQSENLRTCLTGRYPSLCDKSLLTREQLSQTQAAENRAAENRKQNVGKPTVPRGHRYSSSVVSRITGSNLFQMVRS
jgi:predicted chitinase